MNDANQKALEHFKDWSNYLLVTTVAALGWVATASPATCLDKLATAAMAISTIWGIFTLALIPHVEEQRKPSESIYDVKVKCWLCTAITNKLFYVCFVQHVAFIFGIATYALGRILSP